MGTESVSERVYRGLRQKPEIVYHAVSVFRSRENDFYQLFENFDLLEKGEKRFITRYLEDFFKMIEKDRSVENEFIKNARVVDE
jgi:hypothetical protein